MSSSYITWGIDDAITHTCQHGIVYALHDHDPNTPITRLYGLPPVLNEDEENKMPLILPQFESGDVMIGEAYRNSLLGDLRTFAVPSQVRFVSFDLSPTGMGRRGECALAVVSSNSYVGIWTPPTAMSSTLMSELWDVGMQSEKIVAPGTLTGYVNLSDLCPCLVSWMPYVVAHRTTEQHQTQFCSLLLVGTRSLYGAIMLYLIPAWEGKEKTATITLVGGIDSNHAGTFATCVAWAPPPPTTKSSNEWLDFAQLALGRNDGNVTTYQVRGSTIGRPAVVSCIPIRVVNDASHRPVTALSFCPTNHEIIIIARTCELTMGETSVTLPMYCISSLAWVFSYGHNLPLLVVSGLLSTSTSNCGLVMFDISAKTQIKDVNDMFQDLPGNVVTALTSSPNLCAVACLDVMGAMTICRVKRPQADKALIQRVSEFGRKRGYLATWDLLPSLHASDDVDFPLQDSYWASMAYFYVSGGGGDGALLPPRLRRLGQLYEITATRATDHDDDVDVEKFKYWLVKHDMLHDPWAPSMLDVDTTVAQQQPQPHHLQFQCSRTLRELVGFDEIWHAQLCRQCGCPSMFTEGKLRQRGEAQVCAPPYCPMCRIPMICMQRYD